MRNRIGRRLRRLVVASLLRLSRDFVALGSNLGPLPLEGDGVAPKPFKSVTSEGVRSSLSVC